MVWAFKRKENHTPFLFNRLKKLFFLFDFEVKIIQKY